jgi:5-formyltetrahydrofolate cyclo-ligase
MLSAELHEAKKALRAEMLARRTQMTALEVEAAGETIANFVLASAEYAAATTVCSYLAFGQEAPTAPIVCAALADGKRVALPRTLFAQHQLALQEIHGFAGLLPGRYGILAPPLEAPVISPTAIDLFLVPGLAFDAQGNRLGFGAGLYDSVLCHSGGYRMALAYAFQLLPRVPAGADDMPMDLIVTEHGVLACRLRPDESHRA